MNKVVTGCQLFFYLEYDPNLNKVNVNFIEDTYKNNDFDKLKMKIIKGKKKYVYEKEGTYDCNSFNCLKQTFEYFVYLYDLCNELEYPINYRSKRFTIENNDCEAESQNIINEIRRIGEEYQNQIRRTGVPL